MGRSGGTYGGSVVTSGSTMGHLDSVTPVCMSVGDFAKLTKL